MCVCCVAIETMECVCIEADELVLFLSRDTMFTDSQSSAIHIIIIP